MILREDFGVKQLRRSRTSLLSLRALDRPLRLRTCFLPVTQRRKLACDLIEPLEHFVVALGLSRRFLGDKREASTRFKHRSEERRVGKEWRCRWRAMQ